MKKFSLFNTFSGNGIGVSKDDKYTEIPTNFAGFFVMLKRKFWNLSSLNLLYALCNFPVFFFLFTMTKQLHDTTYVVSSPMFQAYFGMEAASSDPQTFSLLYPFVSNFKTAYLDNTAVYVFLGISAMFFITFGLANTGAAYVIRGYTRGDPIFLFSDFFSCIKRNIKQALVVGILDVLFAVVLFWDFTFWQSQPGFMSAMFMYMSLFLFVLYLMMRFYVYTIMITFKLSVYKIIKNSFLLSILGFKRNIVAFLGIFLLLYISAFLLFTVYSIGVMLPAIITISVGMFMAGYASYPVIKKYMITPFYGEDGDKTASDDDDDDVVFVDRG